MDRFEDLVIVKPGVKQSSSVDPLKNVPASHLAIYFSLFSLSSIAPLPPPQSIVLFSFLCFSLSFVLFYFPRSRISCIVPSHPFKEDTEIEIDFPCDCPCSQRLTHGRSSQPSHPSDSLHPVWLLRNRIMITRLTVLGRQYFTLLLIVPTKPEIIVPYVTNLKQNSRIIVSIFFL